MQEGLGGAPVSMTPVRFKHNLFSPGTAQESEIIRPGMPNSGLFKKKKNLTGLQTKVMIALRAVIETFAKIEGKKSLYLPKTNSGFDAIFAFCILEL